MKRKMAGLSCPFQGKRDKPDKRAEQELVDDNFAIFDTYENDFKLTGVPKEPIQLPDNADSSCYWC